jgi:hypothetical protein
MRRINTLEELKAERKRLSYRRLNLERQIKEDFEEIKQSLEPVNLLTAGAKKSLENEKNHLFGNSVGLATTFLAKIALKNSGFLPRLIVPLLVKNMTSSLVEKNKARIFNWIGNIASKVSGKKTAHP